MPSPKEAAGTWSYPTFNVKVSPPPVGFRPTITADSAWARIAHGNGFHGTPKLQLFLAAVTVGKMVGGPAPPRLVYENDLAWISVVAGATYQYIPAPSGPHYSPKPICHQDEPSQGHVDVIDATTGQTIIGGGGSVATDRSPVFIPQS